MISAGLLTDKVTPLHRVARGQDAHGALKYEWLPLTTRAARVTFLRGARALDVQEVWMSGNISVLTRYNKVITESCRLQWEGRTYQIESVNVDRGNGSMTITASRIAE